MPLSERRCPDDSEFRISRGTHKPETTAASEIGIERMLWPGNRGTRESEILEIGILDT